MIVDLLSIPRRRLHSRQRRNRKFEATDTAYMRAILPTIPERAFTPILGHDQPKEGFHSIRAYIHAASAISLLVSPRVSKLIVSCSR